MKTISEIVGLADLTSDRAELASLMEEEVTNSLDAGDFLGAGEWLSSEIEYVPDDKIEVVYSRLISLWGSPLQLRSLPSTIDELVSQIDDYAPDAFAIAVVAASSRLLKKKTFLPVKFNDLAYRVCEQAEVIFEVSGRGPAEICMRAASKFDTVRQSLLDRVNSFLDSNTINAKAAALEVLKKAYLVRRCSLAGERPILSDLDLLLGTGFRKFCESCERQETGGVINRAPDIREHVYHVLKSEKSRGNSTAWNLFVSRVANHILKLLDEGTQRSEAATIPDLRLTAQAFKLDLSKTERELVFSCRIANVGNGRAVGAQLQPKTDELGLEFSIVEPKGPFEIAEHSDQILLLGLILHDYYDKLEIPVVWKCKSVMGVPYESRDVIKIEQQLLQPAWEDLVRDPPYSINPVRKKENLFGRDAVLSQLVLNASAGTSTFLWGQKRVGKTSILQVLVDELQRRGSFVAMLFRIGELISLHEGQIAFRIADRLVHEIPSCDIACPAEEEFGASMSKLIPFVGRLTKKYPPIKFVAVIDEFDDLDPAFYTGERGRQFVHQLRSLSESGLTFFFVGSERMNTIYERHSVVLNKWVNEYLDIIRSREDCRALVQQPVKRVIEYHPESVDFIAEYCGGNPFYIHMICSEIFKRCALEQRTYVSESDIPGVKDILKKSLGETNFAHLWSDNPAIEDEDKLKQSAENCLALTCVSYLGGSYLTPDQVWEVQSKLNLGPNERLSLSDLRSVLSRLQSRKVVSYSSHTSRYEVGLPIFREWLSSNSELQLLPKWKTYCKERDQHESQKASTAPSILVDSHFPIPEEELLSVSQHLVYHGRQKDVSEMRVWLRQFDDDVRIEIGFQLLKRVAEKGFISEGAKLQMLSRAEETVKSKRQHIGRGAWQVVRNRKDDLCITFIDSELKSGGATARELQKRLMPGKAGPPEAISDWVSNHVNKDAIILVVDDFAGTGSTIERGLKNLFAQVRSREAMNVFHREKRILCYVLYAFPEALDALREKFSNIDFLACHVFGDEVRALEDEAGIFEDKSELEFAREVLLQIGTELTPQYPLGYGNMGALVAFHNTVPNNSLPIFWCAGKVNDKPWKPLFPRA